MNNDNLFKIPTVETHEERLHSTTYVPYSIYDCRMPQYHPNVPMHWHSEWEIDYVLSGEGELISGDEHFFCHSGDIVIALPNMLHASYPSSKGLRYMAFVFNGSILGAVEKDRSYSECISPIENNIFMPRLKYDSSHPDYYNIRQAMETIVSEALKNDAGNDLMLKSALYSLFYYFSQEKNKRPEDNSDVSLTALIRPALEYIIYNYERDISIDELSKMCMLSSSYFMGTFKKAVGMSAIDYLSQLRIQAACGALTSSDDEISKIAYSCGFNNLSNFNRQFRKLKGCSPREFRKQKKEA